MNAHRDDLVQQSAPFANFASAGSPPDRLLTLLNVEPRSLFFICVLTLFALLIAYLTNPNELSFRTFVTELALRRHITKLNGGVHGEHHATGGVNASGGRSTSSTPLPTPPPSAPIGPGFHFSNRANVSLRTPEHIAYSFVFFTIVVIAPLANANGRSPGKESRSQVAGAPEGSWYIGALGRWWVGGALEYPYTRAFARKELLGKEEGSTSDSPAGVLGMKCLDRSPPHVGTPTPLLKTSPVKPSKVNRRRSVARKAPGNTSDDETIPRSTTPPPLPKSVSLPLHSARMPPSLPSASRIPGAERVRITPSKSAGKPPGTCSTFGESVSPRSSGFGSRVSTHVPPHLASLDQHPAVLEIVKEIRSTQSSLADLQSQLSSTHKSATIQHQGLQETLLECKHQKLLDDQARAESKSKMKLVEDLRQAAELNKRSVEKRFKAVQTQHDLATTRMQQLDDEIQQLQKIMAEDESKVLKSGIEASANEQEMEQKIQTKHDQLKLAEEVAEALQKRVVELQASIEEATGKLAKVKTEAEEKQRQRIQQNRARMSKSSVSIPAAAGSSQTHLPAARGPPALGFPPITPGGPIPPRQPPVSILQRRNIPPSAEPEPLQIQGSAGPGGNLVAPGETSAVPSLRPRAMSLAGTVSVTVDTSGAPGFTAIANGIRSRNNSNVGPGIIGPRPVPNADHVSPPPSSIFGRRSSVQSHMTFAPFSDDSDSSESLGAGREDAQSLSTFATSLLPTSLVKSMDGGENSPSPSGPSTFSALDQTYSRPEGNGSDSWSNFDRSSVGDGSRSQYHFSPNSAQYSTPDLSLSSPALHSSPDSYVSPRVRFATGFNVPPRSRESTTSDSRAAFEPFASSVDSIDEEKAAKYRRWFPSFINSQAAQLAVFPSERIIPTGANPKLKAKSGLNPDAKVFSFNRGRSSLLSGSNNSTNGVLPSQDAALPTTSQDPPPPLTSAPAPAPPQSSFAARMYGSLTHGLYHRHSSSQDRTAEPVVAPPPEEAANSPTGQFFSSMLAFAPSPAERQALQRGLDGSGSNLGGNGSTSMLSLAPTTSRELKAVSPFTSPLPSAQTSAVDLSHQPSAMSAPWDRELLARQQQTVPAKTSPSTERRTFSSLWLRSKASKSSMNLVETAENKDKEKDKELIANGAALPTTTTLTVSAPDTPEAPVAFGSRFARFTRPKSALLTPVPSDSKE